MTTRGIANVSGVSCHLASALQLMFHTLVPLNTCLVHLAENPISVTEMTVEEKCLNELGSLFQELTSPSSSSSAVDPTRFYQALVSLTLSVDPDELGDAVTALRVLLQTLRSCVEKLSNNVLSSEAETSCWKQLHSILEASIFCGKIRQEIVGRHRPSSGASGIIVVRTKTKIRSMTCPFVISAFGVTCQSLPEALVRTSVEPQSILEYDWDHAKDYVETTTNTVSSPNEDDPENDDGWSTHKTNMLADLPQHLLLNLQQRFSFQNGRVKVLNNEMDVPSELDMDECCFKEMTTSPDCCLQYRLMGAILHVADGEVKAEQEEEEEEGGHYVALVREHSQQGVTADDDVTSVWVLLDDEDVAPITIPDAEIEVLNLLSCRPSTVPTKGEAVATLLIYSRTCHCRSQEDLVSSFVLSIVKAHSFTTNSSKLKDTTKQKEATTGSDDDDDDDSIWAKPDDVVGRRLRVRWAKGKFYSGVVESYNKVTGKHRICYDDGDVREYVMRKKTIEWDDES